MSGRLHPARPLDHGVDAGQLALEEGEELVGGDRLEAEVLDVVAQEEVEASRGRPPLEQDHEEGALLVGHEREDLVGIDAREVVVQLRVRRAGPEAVERAPSARCGRSTACRSAYSRPYSGFEDAPLGVDGEALVEPEVVQVALVTRLPVQECASSCATHVHQRAVAGEQRRRQEGQARVLHAAVGEGTAASRAGRSGPSGRGRRAASAAAIICSTSANSQAAVSTRLGLGVDAASAGRGRARRGRRPRARAGRSGSAAASSKRRCVPPPAPGSCASRRGGHHRASAARAR